MICTFFGNSDCSADIYPLLEKTILDLIQNKKIRDFLVGNHGNYDCFVYTVLKKIKALYPYVRYSVVLAYMPRKDMLFSEKETILPDNIETVPKRYCIACRNRYMVEKADRAVACIQRGGNAEKYVQLAEKKRKTIIYI